MRRPWQVTGDDTCIGHGLSAAHRGLEGVICGDNAQLCSKFCPAAIHERFDLKGTWVDRHAAPGTQPLKDGDWSAARHLSIGDESKLTRRGQTPLSSAEGVRERL